MLEKVYERANEKIYVKSELKEATRIKIIENLENRSEKRNFFYRYRLAATSLCMAVIIGLGIMPGGYLRAAYSKLMYSIKGAFDNNSVYQYGNSMANIANWGYAVKYNNYIFYDSEYGLYKFNIDTNEIIKISDDHPYNINIWENYIYYCNEKDGNLYRISFDGTNKEKIVDNVPYAAVIKDGWIYYSYFKFNGNNAESFIIKRIKVDRTEEMTIVSEKVNFTVDPNIMYLNSVYDPTEPASSEFFLYGDWIYYHNFTDDNKLYKIKIDGTEKTKVSDEKFCNYFFNGQLIIDDGWIYYVKHNSEDQLFEGKLYKMRTDGSDNQLIIDSLVGIINIYKDYIFYSNAEDNNRIYRINKDGSNKKIISNLSVYCINIVGDYLYCHSYSSLDLVHMMNLDGIELEAFHLKYDFGTIDKFIEFANSKYPENFKHLVGPSGLTVIRNFVSGNGSRGNNIKMVYSADQLPSDLKFTVTDEEPITIDNLFPASIKRSSEGIKYITRSEKSFNFKDTNNNSTAEPSTEEIWNLCVELQSQVKDKIGSEPCLYILGNNQLALSEAGGSLNTGSWAIFEEVDGIVYLRTIIEFR